MWFGAIQLEDGRSGKKEQEARVQMLPSADVVRGGHATHALSPRSQTRLLRSGQDHREQHQQRGIQRSLEACHHRTLTMQARHRRLHLACVAIE